MATQKTEQRVHLTLSFGEHDGGECHYCNQCGGKTMLISAPCYWRVDSEPYASGELIECDESEVEVTEEVTAHFCAACRSITSLSLNT